MLDDLSIQTDDACDLDTALALAFEHDLSYYDALYLELAMRSGLPLATLDSDLLAGARQEGVEIDSA